MSLKKNNHIREDRICSLSSPSSLVQVITFSPEIIYSENNENMFIVCHKLKQIWKQWNKIKKQVSFMLLYLTLSVMTYFDIFRQIYIIRFEVFTVIRYGNCKIRHSDFKRKLITSNVLFLPCLIVKS